MSSLTKRSVLVLTYILVFSLFLNFSCSENKAITDSRISMGTVVEITLFDTKDQEVLDGVFNLLDEIENEISANKDGTVIDLINKNAGIEAVEVNHQLFSLIEFALKLSEYSEGGFNIALGPLTKLWAIGSDNPYLPTDEEIISILPLTHYQDIILDSDKDTVFLKKEGMRLDLGAIGKGYAADKVKEYLSNKGVKKAIINLGGNVLIIGNKGNGKEWKVGIANPDNPSSYFHVIGIEEGSVVTSGPYERFFEVNGKKYHHILSSETGYPVDTSLLSVTIISPSSTLADGLSTLVFSLGEEEAEKVANDFKVKIIILNGEKETRIFDGETSH